MFFWFTKCNTPETTEPPKPARPSYDRADWLNRPRISLHGAYWDRMDATTDKSIAGAMEFACPIGETPFDAAARGFWMQRKYRFDDDWQPRHEHHKTNMGVDVWGIWLPWRRNVFSPHAGLGLRCEKINGESKTYHGWNRLDSGESYEYDDSGFSLAGRVGATVTYKRLSLKGEFIIASESSELLGEIAIRLSERIMLSGFLDRFDNDFHDEGADAGLAFGGGLTILFGHPPPAVISAMPMKNQHPRNP